MQTVVNQLKEIVDQGFVSDKLEERLFYSQDGGTMPSAMPDVVVMPATADEVSKILLLANKRLMPVYCMGAGLVLSGLHRPLQGGILLDLKRMNNIIEVNRLSRYVVVEAGMSQGALQAYLKKNYPDLKHSMPDAPPAATIGGNVLIHGSGHLSHLGGFHSDMVTGLEAVLPNGEIVRLGTCSASKYWFARAPLPDLCGLFIGWFATTGVVTKVGLRLYPNHPLSDVSILVCEDAQLMSELLYRVTSTQVGEDIITWMTPKPEWAKGFLHCNICYGGQTKDELRFKRNLLRQSVAELIAKKEAGFLPLPGPMKKRFLDIPGKDLVRFADVRKGGGFEYVGAMIPANLFVKAYDLGLEVAARHQVAYSLGSRIIGPNQCMMFFYAYAFNRMDPADVQKAQRALEETNSRVLELGGIPWKAEIPAQQLILKKMDPSTRRLLQGLRRFLDPKQIMSPGNWEVDNGL